LRFYNRISLSFFLLVLCSTSLVAQQDYYFYKPEINYGTIGSANPINLIVTDGFEMIGILSPSRELNQLQISKRYSLFKEKFKTPLKDLKAYGFSNVINDELFPYNLKESNLNFVPNITAHLLAGGYFYAYLSEYYHYHGFKFPKLMAFGTVYLKNLANEIIETPLVRYTRVDHLTDLFFWDVLAILTFSSSTVKQFFSETISISNWSPIPVLSPSSRISNLKNFIALQRAKKTMLFEPVLMLGLGVMGGLSYALNPSYSLSLLGGSLTQFVYKKYSGRKDILLESITTKEAVGLFLDKNNSLMASLIVKNDKDQFMRLNIFPGLVNNQLGAYVEIGKYPIFGLTFRSLGFGISN